MLDSYTPKIQWPTKNRAIGTIDAISTCVLTQSSSPPRQEYADDVDFPGSSWEGSHTETRVTTDSARRLKSVAPRLTKPSSSHDDAVLLKKWDGFVANILGDGFTVLFGKNAQDGEFLEAEFDIEELCDGDKEILAEGMPVVWCISRERANGGLKRCSTIYLRRQPAPTKAEVTEANRSLDEWFTPAISGTGI